MPLRSALLAASAGALAVQAVYLALARRGVQRSDAAPIPPAAPDVPVTVVVAARNEAHRIGAFVAAMEAQTHRALDIVVVDDGSTDATPAILAAWAARDARVRVLRNTGAPGKKGALTTGIAAARTSVVLLTDADCAPPPAWADALAGHAARPRPPVVVGYAPYHPRPGVLNAVARYETFAAGLLTLAAVGLGRPYMAVGRNLAVPVDAFEAVGGFARHAHLISGDDDLLVQDVHATCAAPVVHALGPDTAVPSEAPTSWRAWLRQKRRHLSDGRHYPADVQMHLAAYHGSAALLWLAPLAGVGGAAMLAARLGLVAWASAPAARRLGERDLLPWLPLHEAGHGLYNALLAPVSMALTLRRW